MASGEDSSVRLGRPGNHLKMGIVGLPNVGKSTLFNCLTQMQVAASNFPFCTIDPNVSRCAVPDARFDWLANHFNPASRVPAYLHVTDIAGLVKGASTGAGLGNNFLSHIRAVDGIFHVTRVFEDGEVTHVEGDIDPVRDLEIIAEELLLKDVEIVQSMMEPAIRAARNARNKAAQDELALLQKIAGVLAEKKPIRFCDWNGKEIDYLNTLQLLTAKPVIYLVNMSEADFLRKKNRFLEAIMKWSKEKSNGELIIPFSAQVEGMLKTIDAAQAEAWCTENKVKSVLDKIILSGYHKLDLIHFFTAGEDEVKCWTVRRGCKAPGAAGTIHTDFEKGFICAEVMAYEDYKQHGSEMAVKAAGRYLQKGREYVVIDGDIIFFKFNAPKGK